jgi:tetratricopeptide (TPR) repeat protein
VNDGNVADAINQYEKALAKNPSIPGIHYELGEAILQNSASSGSLDRAEHEFRAALAENARNAGAEAKLGRIALFRGNIDQAQHQYQRALALQPTQIDALKGMGEICARRGETEKALEYLMRARRVAPLDASVHYQLASLYRKLGRAQDASQELETFQKLRAIKKETTPVPR